VSDALNGMPVQPSYKLVTKAGDLVLDGDGIPLRYAIPSAGDLQKRLETAKAADQLAVENEKDAGRFRRAMRKRREDQLGRGELR